MHRKSITLPYVVTATLLGNTVQWYDYHLFNFLAPILTEVFFPPGHNFASFSYSVLLIIMHGISRLLGAFFFGYEGDKKGRRIALISSISLMTIATFCIGFLPSFSVIGWVAPCSFAILRCIQSFAAGGEFTGGMLYLVESAPPEKRGFYGSFAFFGLSVGIFFSSLNYFFFGMDLSENEFLRWGWRILYLFGGLLGLIVALLRKKFHETHLFLEGKRVLKGEKNPIFELFYHHKKSLVKTFGIGILEAAAFNLLIGFLIYYWSQVLSFPLKDSLTINLIGVFCFPFFILISGKWTAIWKIKKQAVATAFLFIIFSLPVFVWMEHGLMIERTIGFVFLLALLAGYMVCLPGIYCELFPTRVRYIGIGLGYNLAVALIGGTTPESIIYLAKWLTPLVNAGVYLTLAAILSLITLLKTKEKILSIP